MITGWLWVIAVFSNNGFYLGGGDRSEVGVRIGLSRGRTDEAEVEKGR